MCQGCITFWYYYPFTFLGSFAFPSSFTFPGSFAFLRSCCRPPNTYPATPESKALAPSLSLPIVPKKTVAKMIAKTVKRCNPVPPSKKIYSCCEVPVGLFLKLIMATVAAAMKPIATTIETKRILHFANSKFSIIFFSILSKTSYSYTTPSVPGIF
jgi:hypothetical protein